MGGIGAEPHGPAEVTLHGPFDLFVALGPFVHEPDDRVLGRPELGRTRSLDAGLVPRRFDAGHLHAEADAEVRDIFDACKACRLDLAARTALTKTAGDQD